MDHMKCRSIEGVIKIATGARKGARRPSNLREQVDPVTCEIYKQCNWQTPEALNHTGYQNQKNGTIIKRLGSQVLPEKPNSSKLNPDWVEQLMGLPVGWTQLSSVTDPHGNRTDRLRLLGNGVVPQTAEKAFRTLINTVE